MHIASLLLFFLLLGRSKEEIGAGGWSAMRSMRIVLDGRFDLLAFPSFLLSPPLSRVQTAAEAGAVSG